MLGYKMVRVENKTGISRRVMYANGECIELLPGQVKEIEPKAKMVSQVEWAKISAEKGAKLDGYLVYDEAIFRVEPMVVKDETAVPDTTKKAKKVVK